MPELEYLDDAVLEEATYGRISPDAPDRSQSLPDYDQLPDFSEKTLYTWVSPERAFRPRLSASYKRNLALLLVLIVLLLLFLSRMALLIVVLALIFLGFVLANVPPQKIRHTITNYGIYTGEHFYPWLERGRRFWYETVGTEQELIFETHRFPYRVVLLVGHPHNKAHLDEIFSHYLIQQRPEPTDIDKIIAWWQKKFPLE